MKGENWQSSLKMSEDQKHQLQTKFNLKQGDLLIVSSGDHMTNCKVLGRLRNHFASILLSENKLKLKGDYHFLWVFIDLLYLQLL